MSPCFVFLSYRFDPGTTSRGGGQRPSFHPHDCKVGARRDPDAPAVDSINTFEEPNTVVPKPITAKVQDGKLTLTVEPKSVTVVSLEP